MPRRYRVAISSDAKHDIRKAVRSYEEARPGLGRRFRQYLVDALEAAVTRPTSFAVLHRDVRRSMLYRFPYGIYFFLDADIVRVIAVAHLHRRSTVWRKRR